MSDEASAGREERTLQHDDPETEELSEEELEEVAGGKPLIYPENQRKPQSLDAPRKKVGRRRI